MDERDFDDERQRVVSKRIVLHDGREFSREKIFCEFVKDGFKKDYMKEAMYDLIRNTPITIVREENPTPQREINIESLLKKHNKDKDKYTKADFKINGISSEDEHFIDELLKNGEKIILK